MKIEVIDLFAGAGGVTTGAHLAGPAGEVEVVACVNHDAKAIAAHEANHPHCLHFQEDIRTLDVHKLPRNRYLQNVLFAIWASLECTNFSNAKGGKPRDADSRTLAEHLERYIDWCNPDLVFIENVREFMSWGPLNEHGKPLSRDAGKDYLRWVQSICDKGYTYQYRLLNAADFGAHTSRIRYFAIFAKPGIPVAWPEATHAKEPEKAAGLFDKPLKRWKPVREVLDLQDEGLSIFGRKKPLSPKTLARIYAGLVKHVAGGDDSFMMKYYSDPNPGKMVSSLNRPAGSITCVDGHALVSTQFIAQRNSGDPKTRVVSLEDPARTVTGTGGNMDLVTTNTKAAFLAKYRGNSLKTGINNGCSIHEPHPVVATENNLALVSASFISIYHGSGVVSQSVERPSPTVTGAETLAVVQAQFLDKQFSGPENHQSIEQPAGAVLTNDKHSLITAQWIDKAYSSGTHNHQSLEEPGSTITGSGNHHSLVSAKPAWIMPSGFDSPGRTVEEPCPTVVASRRHHYLLNPQWGLQTSDVENPCFTLIARMDKAPPHLVTAEGGELAIHIDKTDCPEMVKIKLFMAEYGIADILMRMLKVVELKRIQGFPDEYVLIGNQGDQKKQLGNAVPVIMAREIWRAQWMVVQGYKRQKVAA